MGDFLTMTIGRSSLFAIALSILWGLLLLLLNYFGEVDTVLNSYLRADSFKKLFDTAVIRKGEFPGKFKEFSYQDVEFFTNFPAKDYRLLMSNKDFKKKKKILFLGDSFMMQYFSRIDNFYQNNIVSSGKDLPVPIFAIKGACFLEIDRSKNNRNDIKKNRLNCIKMITTAIDFAIKENVEKVVISNSFDGYFYADGIEKFSLGLNQDGAMKQIYSMLETFKKNNIKNYFIFSQPSVFYAGNDLKRKVDFSFHTKRLFDVEFFVNKIYRKDVDYPLKDKLRKSFSSVVDKFYDPLDYLCDKQTNICPKLDNDGYPVFADSTHISDRYVLGNMKFIDEIIAN